MPAQLITHTATIVLRGSFNPTLFQPTWLAAHSLISIKEAENARIEIIAPPITSFNLEWLQLQVTEDRFLAASKLEPYFEALRDLVISLFRILEYIPLHLMGINQNFHYQLESVEAWHATGNHLVPKQDWNEVLDNPGMRSLIVEGTRPDNRKGYIQAKVEPVKNKQSDILIEINDHYVLSSDPNSSEGAKIATDILSTNWDESMQRGVKIAQKIISLRELT